MCEVDGVSFHKTLPGSTDIWGTSVGNDHNNSHGEQHMRCSALARTFRADVTNLKQVPRALWVVFLLKVLESFAYFSMSMK